MKEWKAEIVKDYELKSEDLVEILYSDVIQSYVVSLGVTLRMVVRNSNSNVTIEIISKTKTKGG